MGYIQEIGEKLKQDLAGLPGEEQEKIIRFVKERILESFKNGIKTGKGDKGTKKRTRK
jgi:hypothetical protein